ncbi:hypothetical protein BJY00DRAFT_272861 [Aspergillus carlsbadensis]|nr:hypothetical protein BJY00DRAFT_272861 [Aspergillus carlsbadensis]
MRLLRRDYIIRKKRLSPPFLCSKNSSNLIISNFWALYTKHFVLVLAKVYSS